MTLVDELRGCFLFEKLSDEQLTWLAEHGQVVTYDEGEEVFHEGEPAEGFFVLFDGQIQMLKRITGEDVVMNTTDHHGAYAGAIRAFVESADDKVYVNTLRTLTPVRFFRLQADDFAYVLKTWFPMAVHLLDGMFLGLTNVENIVGQREKLVALGSLSAGLAHELNNPAAAEVRAAQALRERLGDARRAIVALAAQVDAETFAEIVALQGAAAEQGRNSEKLSALDAGDREDELGQRLEDAGVPRGWDMAPTLVAAGVDSDWIERVTSLAGNRVEDVLAWMVAALDIDAMVEELSTAAGRITTLVGAMKKYSRVDPSAMEAVDVHEGIENSLVILQHRLKQGMEVVREYDPNLPKVPAYPGELNQVWINIIDNAIDATEGKGTLTIRTGRQADSVLIEIADDGPGIPPELQRRVFEPFITTKEVGKGTGLGLDICYRIVVRRHHGDLTVTSSPGDTRFQIRLPLQQPATTHKK
ncbi:MAG TPA: ATP-binding protein [Acidimicrobiales bacterium]|jgi:signal transduction histidine kinase|nr:ATP-binding protein [Acidimicrobiales bacterium]